MPEVLSHDVDMHPLKVPLPIVEQEEITVGSRQKEEALGQMQSIYGPGHHKRPRGDLRLNLLWSSKEYVFA